MCPISNFRLRDTQTENESDAPAQGRKRVGGRGREKGKKQRKMKRTPKQKSMQCVRFLHHSNNLSEPQSVEEVSLALALPLLLLGRPLVLRGSAMERSGTEWSVVDNAKLKRQSWVFLSLSLSLTRLCSRCARCSTYASSLKKRDVTSSSD